MFKQTFAGKPGSYRRLAGLINCNRGQAVVMLCPVLEQQTRRTLLAGGMTALEEGGVAVGKCCCSKRCYSALLTLMSLMTSSPWP
jgi:hypothetical protein